MIFSRKVYVKNIGVLKKNSEKMFIIQDPKHLIF